MADEGNLLSANEIEKEPLICFIYLYLFIYFNFSFYSCLGKSFTIMAPFPKAGRCRRPRDALYVHCKYRGSPLGPSVEPKKGPSWACIAARVHAVTSLILSPGAPPHPQGPPYVLDFGPPLVRPPFLESIRCSLNAIEASVLSFLCIHDGVL